MMAEDMLESNRPKRSKKRTETGIHGKKYERNIFALVAIKCLVDEDIHDFWIISNPHDVDKFDDIILLTELRDGAKKLFMIQIKHKDDEKKKRPVVAEKLDGNDSNLGLKAYEKAFLEIKQNNNFLEIHEIPNNTEAFFILFNNCEVRRNETENIDFCSTESFRFIDTSANTESTLRIINKKAKYDQHFLDQFYFYTEQLEDKSINDEIGNLLGINADSVKSLVSFFYEWLELKECTKLWKLDVKVHLLDILFGDFIPSRFLEVIDKPILNNVISKFDITVIKHEDSVKSIWNEIFHKMKLFCNGPSIAWNEYVTKQVENKLSSTFKNSETIFVNSEKVTNRLVYIFLSTQRTVPFFIYSNNRLFDSYKGKLQRVLGVYSVVFNVDEIDLNFVNELRVFQDFANIEEDTYLKNSKQIDISFQGRGATDLFNLLKNHETVKQQISVDNYIKLLENNCVVGEANDLPSYYINRKMKVPVLKQEVLRESEFMFFIFKLPMRTKLKNYKSIILEHYESIQGYFEIFGRPFYIITTTAEFDDDYIQRIERLSKDRTYYVIKYIDENGFLLMHTNGCIDILRPYLTHVLKNDTELIDIYKNCKINLICNNAGMGKSTFLNFINSRFLSDDWVIHINLKKYRSTVKKLKTLDELIDFSYTCNTESVNEIFLNFLKPLYRRQQSKIIWLIDDYEEINEPNLLKLFKLATKQGFRIWIVARPYLKLEFENAFDVFSMELAEFEKKDQEMFIKKYLEEKRKNENDIKIIMKAINNIRSLLEDPFIGTCQQIMMLTEIFLNYNDQWKEQEWRIHDIYEKFIKLKIIDDVYVRTISKLAMKVFFTDKALRKVFDLEEFVQDVQKFKDNFPKDFFVTGFGEDDVPLFSHRTYAEFLAARWIWHTMQKQLNGNTPFQVSSVIKLLFLKELNGIRLFLDNMLATHLPLHSAIINKEEDKIGMFINQSGNREMTDILGRNIFHLLSSYGTHFDVGITPEDKKLVRNLDVHSEVVRNGEYILLKPLETEKPTELNSSVSRYISNIDFISTTRMILKEDNLLKLSPTDHALLSGSLLELDSLLQVRNLITFLPLPLTEERKYCLLFHSIQNKYKYILSNLDVRGLNNLKIGQSKMSLLHLAVTANNLDAVKKLTKEHSLDDWGVDSEGNTPLHIACTEKDDSILRHFLDHMDIDVEYLNKKNGNGQSHLYILARRGTSKFFKKIITRFPGVEIDSVCCNGNTPFIMSIAFNNIPVATQLMIRGADVTHGNNKNMTALHYAASKGFLQCVRKLIAWGADVNQKDDYGMTPLMKASTWGHKNIIVLLLRNKAKVNMCDTYKRTALHFAVRRNHLEVVDLLLKCKASVNCVNKVGESPLMVACKYNFPKMVKLLLSRNITYGKRLALWIAVKKGHGECIDLLLRADFPL